MITAQKLARTFTCFAWMRFRAFLSHYSCFNEPLAERGRGFAVAKQAKCAEVVEIALASAFGHGADVIGVPEAAAAGDGLHAVETKTGGAGSASGALERVPCGDGVDSARGADATVAAEDLLAEIAGVGAQAPLVDAVVAAKRAAAFGEDLEIAPAAERQAVGAARQSGGRDVASGEGARHSHDAFPTAVYRASLAAQLRMEEHDHLLKRDR